VLALSSLKVIDEIVDEGRAIPSGGTDFNIGLKRNLETLSNIIPFLLEIKYIKVC